MKLLGISGALRKASTNTGLLRTLRDLSPSGVTFDIATLHGIPLYDGDDEAAHGKPQTVKDLDALEPAADSKTTAPAPAIKVSTAAAPSKSTDTAKVSP